MSEKSPGKRRIYKPQVEEIQRELSRAETLDDFFGKEGIFTMPTMLQKAPVGA